MDGLNSFLLTIAVIIGGVCCGYLLRRLRILDERYGPTISLVIMASGLPLIIFLSIWPISIQTRFALLPCIQVISFLAVLVLSLLLSRFHPLTKADRGTFVMACALSNQGYSMGGLVCYLFFGSVGLGLAQIYVALWTPLIVLVVFPLVNSFSSSPMKKSLAQIVFDGIWHVRSISLVGLAAGIAFSRLQVPYPPWIQTYHLLRILIIASTFASFSVIGLSFHLDHIRKYTRLYFSQALVKFIIAPLLAWLLIILFALNAQELPAKVVLTMAFMPTAVNCVLIVNLFGLNTRMASALFVVNTVIFLLIVLPILAFVVF